MFRLLFVFCVFYLPVCVFSQHDISANFQNEALETVIRQLENDHSLVFSFSQQNIDDQYITINFKNKSLNEALKLIFQGTGLHFEVVNDTFIALKPVSDAEMTTTLCGKIVDPEGEPLPFSNIFIPKTGQGESANEQGSFELVINKGMEGMAEFSYIGYQKKQVKINELKGCPTIVLSLQAFSFSEIIVKEYITEGIEQSEDLNHVILHPDQIDVVPGLTEADVLQMVEILPGVQSLDESATGLHIRGGTPEQNLILWDGIPVYNSGHFFGMISAFNPFIVDKVKVFRGHFGAEYGGRVGGVIDIQSEQQIPEKTKVNLGMNFTNSDASVVFPMFGKKAAFLLSARQSYTNILESPTFKSLSDQLFNRGRIEANSTFSEDEELELSLDFSFTDLNAKWWGQLGEKNTFSLSFFGIFDKLDYNFEDIENNESEADNLKLSNLGWSAKWVHQWNSDFSSTSKILFTNFQNTYEYLLGDNDSWFSVTDHINEVQDLTFDLTNHWQVSSKTDLEFGYQFSSYLVKRDFIRSDELSEFFTNDHALHSTFLSLKSYLNPKLKFNTGLRYSYYTGLSEYHLEPRFSLHYLPNANWQFKLSAGEYRQFISQILTLNELGFNEQLWAMSDEEEMNPVAKSQHLSAGIFFHRPGFQVEIETYFKQLSGLASWSESFLHTLSEGALIEGSGTVKGIDILLKKRWNSYQTWISYSLSQTRYIFEDFNEENPFSAPHDRPHSLNFVHLLNYKNWQFSIAWKYATGKAYTEVEELSDINGDFVPFYDPDVINEDRLPDYHRLDASVLYEISPPEKNWKASIGLSFLNLYNRKNILNRRFTVIFEDPHEEDEPSLQTLNQPSLRFTPNLAIRFKF